MYANMSVCQSMQIRAVTVWMGICSNRQKRCSVRTSEEISGRTVRTMTIEQAIEHAEEVATEQERLMSRYDAASGYTRSGNEAIRTESSKECEKCAEEHRQLAEWLRILKKAKFEYDEAWRIITHPTPDVTYVDRNRAQLILDTFRDSFGRME